MHALCARVELWGLPHWWVARSFCRWPRHPVARKSWTWVRRGWTPPAAQTKQLHGGRIQILLYYDLILYFIILVCELFGCVMPTSSSTALIGFWLLAKPMKSHGTVRPCYRDRRIRVCWRVRKSWQEYTLPCSRSYLHAARDQYRPSDTTRLLITFSAAYLVQQLIKAVLSVRTRLSEVNFTGFERQDPAPINQQMRSIE